MLLGLLNIFVLQGCVSGELFGASELASIEFAGNNQVSDSLLLDALASKESSWIPLIGEKFYITEESSREERERVLRKYESVGIYGTRVESQILPRGKKRALIFNINEGQQILIQDVAVNGIPNNLQAELTLVPEAFLTQKGKKFTEEWYLSNKAQMMANLANRGFPYAQLESRVTINPKTYLAVIKLDVTLGRRYKISSIAVTIADEKDIGVSKEQILAHTFLKPGDFYSLENLEASKSELLSLGFFLSVEIVIPSIPPDSDELTVQVNLVIGPEQSLKTGFGIGVSSGRQELRGVLKYTHSNLFGELRRLETQFKPSYVFLPSFAKPELRGWAGTFTSQLIKPDFLYTAGARDLNGVVGLKLERDLQKSYLSDSFAMRPGLSWPARSLSQVELGINHEIFNLGKVPESLNPCVNLCRLYFLDQSIISDKRNKPSFPDQGYLLKVRFAETIGIGDFQYLEVNPQARGYLKISTGIILASKIEMGNIFNFGREEPPIVKRYFLGGATSHRGFPNRELSPGTILSNGKRFSTGGNSMFLFSQEFRIQAWKSLWFAPFFDSGAVSGQAKSNTLAALNHAAGLGLALNSAFIPLRIDFAYRTNDRSEFQHLSKFAFHLNLGESF